MIPKRVPGSSIRTLRSLLGIKQSEAARRLKISQQAYSKIENSESVKMITLEKILLVFNYNKEDFFKFSPPPAKSVLK